MTYISIRQILDDLLAEDIMKGLSLERAVNYAVEFIKVVGMPNLFNEKEATVNIQNYRGTLPNDLYEIIQVKGSDEVCYVNTSDSFTQTSKYTYKVQGNVIFTGTEKETLTISYRAFVKDTDGYPAIIDNGTFARALEFYIQKRWFTALFNSGKISQAILQNVQQEYAFYVGQAQADLVRPTVDQLQSITNMWTALLPRARQHSEGFKTLSTPEVLKF